MSNEITCNSIAINNEAARLGGKPELVNWAYADGATERIALWELPNGFRAIETNGEPVFEAASPAEFAALAAQIGE